MPTLFRRRLAPLGTAAVLALGLTWTAIPASAHVVVRPDTTAAGSFAALTFRVPNESDSASTVEVSVELPQATPLLYVSTKPVPGWTVATTTAKLPKPVESYGTTITEAIRTVTWTAAKGSEIGPGQYQEFSLSAGPLPQPGTLLFPAAQTYSDGKVVNWSEPTPESGAEPEYPAPAMIVTAAEPEVDTTPSAAAGTASTAATGGGGGTLAGAALGVGVAALVLGIAAVVLSLRRRSGAT
jgi:periplasmic copper chaperone A